MGDKLGKDVQKTQSLGVVDSAIAKIHTLIDRVLPPAQREKWLAQAKEFAVSNPKITAFLLTNIILSGPPLVLFIVFTITVFIIALLTGLVIGILGALLFTVFMVLVALFVVLPTLFLTTFAATFLAFWGLGAFYIIKWFNEGKTPSEIGSSIGGKLSGLVGGSLNGLMSTARATKEKVPKEAEAVLNGDGNGISTGKFSESTANAAQQVAGVKDAKSDDPDAGL